MGAYDNMFSNASTFKVELDEWYGLHVCRIVEMLTSPFSCKILRDATPKSFVILDELGRVDNDATLERYAEMALVLWSRRSNDALGTRHTTSAGRTASRRLLRDCSHQTCGL